MNSVHTLRAVFTLESFNNAQRRAREKQRWIEAKRQFGDKAVAFPDDANSVETYFWITDGTRWRCEKNRSYPRVGNDFDQAIYDGEKYTVFNSYRDRAFISANNDKVFPLCETTPQSGAIVGIGWYNTILQTEDQGFTFRPEGWEEINGFECVRFSASKETLPNEKGTITFWVAPQEDYLLIKWREEDSIDDDISINDTVVLKTRRITDVVAASDVKQEYFRAHQGGKKNLQWEFTRHYTLRDCQFNLSVGDGYFEDVLPIGTSMFDEVEHPGEVVHLGGDTTEEIRKVFGGIPPAIEEPHVQAGISSSAQGQVKPQ